jgi:hypothetical protein
MRNVAENLNYLAKLYYKSTFCMAVMSQAFAKKLSIGEVYCNNSSDSNTQLYLPWPPWVIRLKYLCHATQCGIEKYEG